jgi:S-adenosylmethionine hydrolase
MALVTLLTDFGTADSYVGEVKGVLLSLAPGATLVDLSHAIPPGQVAAGAYVLQRCWPRFPAGTIHLAVVDPGVGTARAGVALRAGGQYFVGPDNGLFGGVRSAGDVTMIVLPTPAGASATFVATCLPQPPAWLASEPPNHSDPPFPGQRCPTPSLPGGVVGN